MKPLRIGFVSAADIGRKNWKAIRDSGNCVVSAVASRDAAKSREYIRQCQAEAAFETVPRALGGYDALIASPEVDAVYVPVPTGLRKEWVLRAARSGKHVLCEKPCGVNLGELEEMVAACRGHGVQFMDGVMFLHHPRLAQVRAALDDGRSVGRIQRLSAWFSFYAGEEFFEGNIRVDPRLEPAGCLGDLGWYPLRFFLWALGWQRPRAVRGSVLTQTATGVPTEFSAELFFEDGVTAQCYCSFLSALQQHATVAGRNGWLRIPDFVLPPATSAVAYELNGAAVGLDAGAKGPRGDGPVTQEAHMWRNFADQIFSGRLNDDWPTWALKTQEVMDACAAAGRTGKLVEW